MTKRERLKICNFALLFLLVATLISSIQLEISHCQNASSVILHIIVATLFMLCAVYHFQLHFGWKRWFDKFAKQKSVVTRILWWLFLLTIVSAIIALAHWIPTGIHSVAGGIHGKIGFLMAALAIGHTIKRAAFFIKKTGPGAKAKNCIMAQES